MVKLGVEIFFFKIPIGRTVFNFSCKTSGFTGGFSFFWSTFCQFFVIFSCNTSAFCGAGWSFWVKKIHFFHAKLQFLRGWVVFLSKKNTFFWDFLENVGKLKFWLKAVLIFLGVKSNFYGVKNPRIFAILRPWKMKLHQWKKMILVKW